ncbi:MULTISPECIES: hypothetical protein [unclassified Streptosporangium]
MLRCGRAEQLPLRVGRLLRGELQAAAQGHVTDRYTKAIEQLGSDKL